MMRYFFLTVLCVAIFIHRSSAFNFQEHKLIGNAAFQNTYLWLTQQSFFSNEEELKSFFAEYLNIRADSGKYIFTRLSWPPNQITYGDLNGLSGDHEEDPLTLIEDLEYRYSIVNRSVLIQNEYGDKFFTNGPDKLLFKTDKRYGFFALTNYNHFYYYGESLTSHLRDVEKENILDLLQPKDLDEVIKKLNKSHSINTYVTLHCAAMLLAQKAGEYYRLQEKEKCTEYFFYAIIFNAFADHYIEDACASGHLVVNRSYFGSVINNKPLHDFYNRSGLEVLNMQGKVWKEFGDNNMLKEISSRDTSSTYLDLDRVKNETFEMASRAVTTSLEEVFSQFISSAEGKPVSLDIPDDKANIKVREAFYTANCKALQIIPLPYNSHLENYFQNDSMLKAVERFNWLPPYRNYVRRRVANTLLLDYGFAHPSDFSSSSFIFSGGLRFILSGKGYSYTDRLDKKGSFDQWPGLTMSFHINHYPKENEEDENIDEFRYQLQGGLYRCFDYWIGNKRFLNFHGYIEGGAQLIGNKVQAMFTPTIGVEVLPLFGFNRKPLPKSVSIPLEIILPVKIFLSYQMIHGQRPQWVIGNQVDIVF